MVFTTDLRTAETPDHPDHPWSLDGIYIYSFTASEPASEEAPSTSLHFFFVDHAFSLLSFSLPVVAS